MSSSDEIILNRIQRGDERAWIELYKSILPSIIRHIKANSGTEDDARDVFQDVIIDFRDKIIQGKLTLTADLKTYVFAMCKLQWLKRLRKKATIREIPLPNDMEIVDVDEHTEDYERELSARQRIAQECFEKLRSTCRTVIQLFFFEAMTMDQIALRAGLANADVAKNTKAKCMRQLRECVLEQFRSEM